MRRLVLAVILAGLGVPCAPVLAATVRVDHSGSALIYRAAPGERNHLRLTASAEIWMRDSVAIHAGPGCGRVDRFRVRCERSPRTVVRLGDRSDRAHVHGSFDTVFLDGGRGDDVLVGGPEADTFLGGRGTDDLRGGAGVDRLLDRAYGLSRDLTADRLRGGRGSDLLMGSRGPNLIEPGPGVDQVYAGGGRDIVLTREGTIEQVHCGAGEDSAVTDGFDYPLSCEHHEPYSRPATVPVAIFSGPVEPPEASVLVGCREKHPAPCAGTVQLEAGGSPLSEEVAFTGAERHRLSVRVLMSSPLPADWPSRSDVAVRIRAQDAAGVPTDDSYPVRALLVGDPFLG